MWRVALLASLFGCASESTDEAFTRSCSEFAAPRYSVYNPASACEIDTTGVPLRFVLVGNASIPDTDVGPPVTQTAAPDGAHFSSKARTWIDDPGEFGIAVEVVVDGNITCRWLRCE